MLELNTKVWVNVSTLEYFPVIVGEVNADKVLCDEIIKTKYPELLEPLSPKMKLGTINTDFTYGPAVLSPSKRSGILFNFVKHAPGCVFRNTSNECTKQKFPFSSTKNEFIWMNCEIEYRGLSGIDPQKLDMTRHLKITWGYSLDEVNTMIGVFFKPKPDPVSVNNIALHMQRQIENKKTAKNENAKKQIAVKLHELGYESKLMHRQIMGLTLEKEGKIVTLPNYLNFIKVQYDDDECKNKRNSLSLTASSRHSFTCGTGIIPTLEKWIELCKEDSNTSLKLAITLNNSHLEHELENAHSIELLNKLKEMAIFHNCSTDGPRYYIENTMHHVYEKKLDHAKACAIWPELESLDDCTHEALVARFQNVMRQFRSHIRYLEDFGFVY